MKVVLADSMLSASADAVFGATQPLHSLDAWMGVLAFSGQIFFDFAGYSTCAIGIGLSLGFSLPDNFLYPYAAIGFSDFWRRWHITLSSWLRDYLYIPLGGNRAKKVRVYTNLMITMLLGGLWHGASWTFVVWGGLHGLYLCIEKFIQDRSNRRSLIKIPVSIDKKEKVVVQSILTAPRFLRKIWPANFLLALFTFFLVNITWVFFRATDFNNAWSILGSMFGAVNKGVPVLSTLSLLKVGVVITLMVFTHWKMRDTKVLQVAQRIPWWAVGIVWAFMLILLILSQESSNSFIYFQF
jgi:D-alanyl-lipoteichoic acid acyltransferase DltB (MBOAT superfamily)